MAKKAGGSRKRPPSCAEDGEAANLLESLRAHGRVVEAADEDAELPPGATHVLVGKPGAKKRLVEKRKSFL